MTRKRFKKLLMGQHGYSRNEAENLSRWPNRSIRKINNGTIINEQIFIIEKLDLSYKIGDRETYAEEFWKTVTKLVDEGMERAKNERDR